MQLFRGRVGGVALPDDISFIQPFTDGQIEKLFDEQLKFFEVISCPPGNIYFLSRATHAETATGAAIMGYSKERSGVITNVKVDDGG